MHITRQDLPATKSGTDLLAMLTKATQEGKAAAADLCSTRLDKLARELEDKLEGLRNAQPREIRTEVLKPVFTNRCLSDEFVSMYNSAVAGTERALSGKPENTMRHAAAAPERGNR